MKKSLLLAGLLYAVAFGQDYPTSQRIQISEPCSSIAKWITQGLSASPRFQMLRYEPELGTLTFNVISQDKIAKAYLADDSKKVKNVRVDGLAFTLRSLVSSTLSFDTDTTHSTGDSCTISSAFKLAAKDGVAFSNGKMETELLQTLKKRYQEHGLDY